MTNEARMIDMDDCSIQLELLEYGRKQGVITQADYTKKMFRSKYSKGQKKVQKLGLKEIYVVLRVDSQGGFIDLTKLEIKPEDQQRIEDNFAKGKSVQSLMISLSEKLGFPLETLYQKIVFPLQKGGKHAFDVLHANIFELDKLVAKLDLDPKLAKELTDVVRLRYTPAPEKIKAVFELRTLSKEGVLDIREVLTKAEKMQTTELPLLVNLEATPYYAIQTTTPNRQKAVDLITEVLKVVEAEIEKLPGGRYELKSFNQLKEEDEHEYAGLMQINAGEDKRSVVDEDNDEDMGYTEEEPGF